MADFEYKEAREKAPDSIQERIEQYDALPEERKMKIPLLYWVLGTGTPPYKMSQPDSEYVDESTIETQECANCKFMYHQPLRDSYICSQIRGKVKPEGWCRLWKGD